MLGDAIDIYIAENGRRCFATVRTIEAVNFPESFIMQRVKCVIDVLLTGETLQKLFVLLLELIGLIEVLSQFLRN
jgi:hypothetical protein